MNTIYGDLIKLAKVREFDLIIQSTELLSLSKEDVCSVTKVGMF